MNTQDEIKALSFLIPPKKYYWRWSEDGEAIELPTGETILFRKELEIILKALSGTPLPPIGAIALIALGMRGFLANSQESLLPVRSLLMAGASNLRSAQEQFELLVESLEKLESYPKEECKSPQQFASFLSALFHGKRPGPSIDSTDGIFHVFKNRFHIEAIDSEQFDASSSTEVKKDTTAVIEALADFSVERTRYLIQTGIGTDKLSTPQTDFLSLLENRVSAMIEESSELPLLEQLENDPKHSGVAKLTRLMIAAISLPQRAGYPDQQYSGGISDITNRGQLDRLLLSELAQEDDILVARLANNEALYTHKEPKAEIRIESRSVFVDTGIFLWGLPRVFATAVALAFKELAKTGAKTEIFSLVEGSFKLTPMESVSDVNNVLSLLDPLPDPWKSVAEHFSQAPETASEDELFFITSKEAFASPDRDRFLSEIPNDSLYIAIVQRTGEFALYLRKAGSMKLISESKIDLKDILAPKEAEKLAYGFPEIISMDPWPLLAPTEPRYQTCVDLVEKGMIGLSADGRLMRWGQDLNGFATQLAPLQISAPNSWIQVIDEIAYVLEAVPIYDANIKNNRRIRVYRCPLNGTRPHEEIALRRSEFPLKEVIFQSEMAILLGDKTALGINLKSGLAMSEFELPKSYSLHLNRYIDEHKGHWGLHYNGLSLEFVKLDRDNKAPPIGDLGPNRYQSHTTSKRIKAHAKTSSNTIVNLQSVFFDANGSLHFRSKRDHVWRLVRGGEQSIETFRFEKSGRLPVAKDEIPFQTIESSSKQKHRLRKAVLPNGNTVYLDLRGYFHLYFNDRTHSTISILLIQEKATIAWTKEKGLFGNLPLAGGQKVIADPTLIATIKKFGGYET